MRPVTGDADILLVENAVALAAVLPELAAQPRLALDVEADGLYRYRARLCALQLATPTRVVLVDTLALGDPSLLAPLLGGDGPLKIVHDAAFDARLLAEVGVPLGRVLDTSVCARFLGDPQLGLASQLEKRLGIVVTKDRQKADWGVRPLTEDDTAYLAGDVRHLLALADALLAEAATHDVLEAVEEESRWVLARAEEPPRAAPPPWTRIKGAVERPPPERGALRELAAARELLAAARDVPPFRVIVNDALLAIARRAPTSRADLARIAPRAASDEELATALVEAVARGRALGDAPAEDLARPPGLPPEERAARGVREKALQTWRRDTAKARNQDPQAVLPGHCVAELVASAPRNHDELATVAGLGAFRVTRDGDAILACMRPAPSAAPA